MFDGPDYPKSLDEEQFDGWLENGRSSKMSYEYLLVIWNEFDSEYQPVYAESRSIVSKYEPYGESTGYESLVAVYDLYSESRIRIS